MRVYKLKLAFEVFFFFFGFVLFEVAAEQVPLRKIREITLYRADVFFFFFCSLFLSGPLRCALERLGHPGTSDGEKVGNVRFNFQM